MNQGHDYTIEEYITIAHSELEKAGKKYDESQSLYANLFICDNPACTFRTLYFYEYERHVSQGFHIQYAKDGISY